MTRVITGTRRWKKKSRLVFQKVDRITQNPNVSTDNNKLLHQLLNICSDCCEQLTFESLKILAARRL